MLGKQQIVDTKFGNIYYYYSVHKTMVVGNTHGMKIILILPLKSVNQNFILYKLIVMPKRVSGDKFIKYLLNILDYRSVGEIIFC